VLCIQLKRFEFDYNTGLPAKFNDLFEFPRTLDMTPYTSSGLARVEGERIETDDDDSATDDALYRLRGIVVHSGQASGGHYYSYISCEAAATSENANMSTRQWYRFDDTDVTLADLNDDSILRRECFGGENDALLGSKGAGALRNSMRWWNAYLLFYERVNPIVTTAMDTSPACHDGTPSPHAGIAHSHTLTSVVMPHSTTVSSMRLSHMSLSARLRMMPVELETLVRARNAAHVHENAPHTRTYFDGIKTLARTVRSLSALSSSTPVDAALSTQASLRCTQLFMRTLFLSAMRAKRTVRGELSTWTDTLLALIAHSAVCRMYIVHVLCATQQSTLSTQSERMCLAARYLIDSTVAEVSARVNMRSHHDCSIVNGCAPYSFNWLTLLLTTSRWRKSTTTTNAC
jgi:ubiquitin carboxyl-terminal hydrolase 9/24